MSNPIFNSPSTNPFGLVDVGDAASPTFVDIDHDGDLDLFIGNNLGQELFYRNTGTASSASFVAEGGTSPFGLPDVGTSANPVFVDIDKDGDLDAFIGEILSKTLFYRNTSMTSDPSFVAVSSGNIISTIAGSDYYYASPALVDIDNDGDLDAFVGGWAGKTLFYRNNGTASNPVFAAANTSSFGLTDVGSNATPTFADIDKDGDLDAFVGNNNGDTLFFRNTGTVSVAGFIAEGGSAPFNIANFGSFTSPTLADIDSDGDLDLFVGNNAGNTLFYLNVVNTAPVVAIALSNQVAKKSVAFSYTVPANSFTDVDAGDTLSYTASLASGSALPAWLSFNSATRSFSGIPSTSGALSLQVTATDSAGASVSSNFALTVTNPDSHILTDFFGDGKSDLLWKHTDGSIYAMNMNGLNIGTGAVIYDAAATANGAWQVVGSKGDYNGDGKTDLLFWNSSSHSAYMTKMNGASISSEGTVSYAQNISGWAVADSSADYNNDGKSDILWWNSSSSSVYLALQNGSTLLSGDFLLSNISGWAIKSAGGDYNGDGNSDILLWNSSTGSAYLMTMNGLTATSQAYIAQNLPSAWTIVDAKGDFNGDGKSDILLRNSSTGELWEYLMNGTSISSSASVSTIATTYQLISAHNDFNGDGKSDLLWKNSDGSAWISLVNGNSITSTVSLGSYSGWTVQNADNDVNADAKADVLWTNSADAVAIMLMDGTTISNVATLGAYSGWSINNANSIAAAEPIAADDFTVELTGVIDSTIV